MQMGRQTIREFRLAPPGSGRGVSCDAKGAFVAATPLLKRNGEDRWEPRDCAELSKQIGADFGLPIDMSAKMGGIKAISHALNEGDIARAQIAAVLLAIPDAPPLVKGTRSRNDVIKFVRDLDWSGLIKANWDSDEHPRWPSGAPDSQGGQFAPKGNDAASQSQSNNRDGDSVASNASAQDRSQRETIDDAVYRPDRDPVELDPTASSPGQLRQNWQQHEDEVNRQVQWLENKGRGNLIVTKNVSFLGPDGTRITVDYVVSVFMPDGFAGFWLEPVYGADVKTGRGGLTENQRQVYPPIGSGTWVTPVGLNAEIAGFRVGEKVYFPIVYGDALSTTEH